MECKVTGLACRRDCAEGSCKLDGPVPPAQDPKVITDMITVQDREAIELQIGSIMALSAQQEPEVRALIDGARDMIIKVVHQTNAACPNAGDMALGWAGALRSLGRDA